MHIFFFLSIVNQQVSTSQSIKMLLIMFLCHGNSPSFWKWLWHKNGALKDCWDVPSNDILWAYYIQDYLDAITALRNCFHMLLCLKGKAVVILVIEYLHSSSWNLMIAWNNQYVGFKYKKYCFNICVLTCYR